MPERNEGKQILVAAFEIKGQGIEEKRRLLIDEPSELLKIFGAIIEKIK